MKLVEPSADYRETFLDFVRDVKNTGYLTYDIYRSAETDFGAYLRKLKDQAAGINIDEGWCPCRSFWLVDDSAAVAGVIRIRFDMKPELRMNFGNIGYEIKSSERGRGYGSLLLNEGLKEARKLGLKTAVLICRPGNTASAGLIRKFGGELTAEFCDGDISLLRFEIDLEKKDKG